MNKNAGKPPAFTEMDDAAKRQFIDARTVFVELEKARAAQTSVRGGMAWKRVDSRQYLIRTSASGGQKGLGARGPDTEAMYERFIKRKRELNERVDSLQEALVRHERRNKAEFVGRTPQIVVDILNRLARAGIAEHFLVVGTHALYAYEQAALVRIANPGAMATQDVDLLWDTRRRAQFISTMAFQGSSMLGLLRKVDATFRIRDDQAYTAINARGFEVDILRRERGDDPHPLRLTERGEGEDGAEEFWAIEAKRANVLLQADRLSTPVVSANGTMARMTTVSPATFIEFKRWMAEQADRDPDKRSRDRLQAEVVEQIMASREPGTGTAA
jgi:hypothetical protein